MFSYILLYIWTNLEMSALYLVYGHRRVAVQQRLKDISHPQRVRFGDSKRNARTGAMGWGGVRVTLREGEGGSHVCLRCANSMEDSVMLGIIYCQKMRFEYTQKYKQITKPDNM
jgi:hypothetical protein